MPMYLRKQYSSQYIYTIGIGEQTHMNEQYKDILTYWNNFNFYFK